MVSFKKYSKLSNFPLYRVTESKLLFVSVLSPHFLQLDVNNQYNHTIWKNEFRPVVNLIGNSSEENFKLGGIWESANARTIKQYLEHKNSFLTRVVCKRISQQATIRDRERFVSIILEKRLNLIKLVLIRIWFIQLFPEQFAKIKYSNYLDDNNNNFDFSCLYRFIINTKRRH